MDYNINLILDDIEKLKKLFTSIDYKNLDSDKRLELSSKFQLYIREIYMYLAEMPENDFKSTVEFIIDDIVDKINNFSENFDESLYKETMFSLNSLYGFINEKRVELGNDKYVDLYNTKLSVYEKSLNDCKQKQKLYKEGKIPYELYYESIVFCYENYLELTGIHTSLGNTSLELPKKPPKILRSVEDLKIKTFLEDLNHYESLLDTYEDEYDNYVENAKKYDNDELSYEDYAISASSTFDLYSSAKKAYEDILNKYKTIEEGFVYNDEFVIASKETLNIFYAELEEYNKELEEYNKLLKELEELEEKLSQGLISQEEYDIKFNVVKNMETKLVEKNKKLNAKRKLIYNTNVLTTLNEQKIVFESHLKISTISDEERNEITNKLNGVNTRIKEIESFKKTVKIRVVKKMEHKKVVRDPSKVSTRKKSSSIPKPGIEKPSEFFAFDVEPEKPLKIVKVKEKSFWQKHKKKILIALGLSALAVSLVVLVTQLLPAIAAAQQLSTVSNLMGAMTSNGASWFTASAAEQVALHGANTGLASQIQALTGMATTFTESTGVWTIGGQTLSAAAKTAAAKAASAASLVKGLNATTLISGLGGLGTLGIGLLTNDRTDEYKKLNNDIKNIQKNIKVYSDNEFSQKVNELYAEIESSKKSNVITKEEYTVLIKKMNSLLKKKVKYRSKVEKINIENSQIEDEVKRVM